MKLQSYAATVRVRMGGGGTIFIRTQVQAEDINRAKRLLEAQYGVGNVVGALQRIQ
jgi:hypothetical protein